MTKAQNTEKKKENDKYFLGFDLSTQQIKALIINQSLKIIHSEKVEFSKDLPQYETTKGVYIDGSSIFAPVAMWLDAIDLLMSKLISNKESVDVSKIVAISGSCQQHGSVYWNSQGDLLLRHLDPNKKLSEQLSGALAYDMSPNWQDHSTEKQCDEFNNKLDGKMKELARVTGSRAHFRFTGPQIAKIAEKTPKIYEKTSKIQLVSNFLCSILVGRLVPLEEADCCGMNLYDIEKRQFNSKLLEIIEPNNVLNVRSKLNGEPWPFAGESLPTGLINSYFQLKYGFDPACEIYPFTGDNLATILSLPLSKNDVLISLGTSTTVLVVTDNYHPSPNYHLFIHPTIPNHYMGMICYCNGSLAREKIRDIVNDGNGNSWDKFDEILSSSSNKSTVDEMAVYFPLDEIVPSVSKAIKRCKFDVETGKILKFVDSFGNIADDVKLIVESQALSCRVRITPLLSSNSVEDSGTGIKFDYDKLPMSSFIKNKPKRCFFVGGGSKNTAIVSKFAKILGAPSDCNYRLETPNSCALGGCYKAMWSYEHQRDAEGTGSFDQFLSSKFNWETDLERVEVSGEDEEYILSKIKPLSELEQSL
ncbi:related to Xylulose kinase [Saccharomycodes ludwigii]|uniref:Xylulose kinase n=1 Tax=Saccharomycodes ludwigii TaxID=36035 RepID=A0A376B822_9ASCO|nr:hypothetical protein SCDLUD_004446 [Saccharomycodes ludwigii]KAH3899025.1 hypothetical protein SCDLUD_004446 [Saccharomycodes ludwigii]SSD60719.1 related to Xylulose kinase [Saccharomycodes ludwigii]